MHEGQFSDVIEWQNKTFKQSTAKSKVAHLSQEIKELNDELNKETQNDNEIRLEFADCFILLMGAAASYGLSYKDVVFAISAKMKINRKRKWGKPDKYGVVNHVK